MYVRYVLYYRCGYVIRICFKLVFNIIFYYVEFYRFMYRKCVKLFTYNVYIYMYMLLVRLLIKFFRLIYINMEFRY